MPTGEPALHRRAAARQLAVVMRGLGEAHRDAGADRGRQADEEGLPGVLRGESRGKDRRQRRHRAVHQAGQSRLHIGQDELPPLCARPPPALTSSGTCFSPSRRAEHLMALSRPRRDRRAACASRHRSCASPPRHKSARPPPPSPRPAPTHGLDAERPDQPVGLALVIAAAHARAGSAGCARRSASGAARSARRDGRPPLPPSPRTPWPIAGSSSRSPSA